MGQYYSEEELADEMLKLQKQGAHNINLVSPSHVASQILNSIILAKEKGLTLPIVYNSNGYDLVELLKQFEGYINIYLPDIKYSNDENALKYSRAKKYVERNRAAISEMYRQVGNLEIDKDGIAKKGVLIRHLVLPEDIAGSYESLKFLSSLSKDIWISVMSQYHPCYKAVEYKALARRISSAEYERVLDWVNELGFTKAFKREFYSRLRPRLLERRIQFNDWPGTKS